jgi:hypothetical protein
MKYTAKIPHIELEELKLLSTVEVGPRELMLIGLFKISFSAVRLCGVE